MLPARIRSAACLAAAASRWRCSLRLRRRRAPTSSCATPPRAASASPSATATRSGWTTEGWWTLAAQTCETLFKGALPSRYWYVHAIDYDRGGEWAGQSFMCTTDKAFTIRGVQDCPQRGYKRTGFFEVDTQDANDWTIRLTDPSEGGARLK